MTLIFICLINTAIDRLVMKILKGEAISILNLLNVKSPFITITLWFTVTHIVVLVEVPSKI